MGTILSLKCKHALGLLFVVTLLFFAQITYGQVQIQDVTSTVSSCPNNGSITIDATSSNPPLLYSIVAGPVNQPEQTSAAFNSLPPGDYTVKVSDIAGNEATETITVTGTYETLDFNLYPSSPDCPGENNGSVSGYILAGTGKGPFTWDLTDPPAYATGAQASNTFSNLPAGDYTISATDDCGAFRTRTIKITDPESSISLVTGSPYATMVGCDSALIEIDVSVNGYSPPYNVTIGSNTSTVTVVDEQIKSETLPYRIQLLELVEGLTYGDHVSIEVTDNCNRSVSFEANLREFTFCSSFIPTLKNCEYLDESFTNNSFNCLKTGFMGTFIGPPVSYELKDGTDGSVIETGTVLNSELEWMKGINGVYPDSIKEGKSYEISISDKCGNTFNDSYTAPIISNSSQEPEVRFLSTRKSECVDSVAFAYLRAYYFKSNPTLVVTSGPSGIKSSKDGFEYEYSFTYPDTIRSNGSSTNFSDFDIAHLGIGTYEYIVEDNCGNKVTGSFEIKPEDLGALNSTDNVFSYKPGCLGKNQINFAITHGGEVRITNNISGFSWIKDYTVPDGDTLRDSVQNLVPGTYHVWLRRGHGTGEGINDIDPSCYEFRKTIKVEDGVAPDVYTYNALMCGNTILAEIFPDSSKGVPPYEYEIISGPETFPRQNDNVFNLNSPGVYNVRIYDACGNASTREISIEDLDFEPLNANVTCSQARVIYPSSDYYFHEWTRPDGSEFTADSLIISSITPADTGTYYVSQIVEISGCRDTFLSSHHIKLAVSYLIQDSICEGESYTLGSRILTEEGIYYDTLIAASGCDSIIELDLKIRDYLTGSRSDIICPGGNIVIAGEIYDTPGIYKDTLTTATCDSILTIEITFGDYLTGTVEDSICPGGVTSVAGKTYDTEGIFSDTLFTGSCDSIITINITQLDYLRGSLDTSFCKGKDVSLYGAVYDSPGVYSDTISNTGTCDSVIAISIQEEDYLRGVLNDSICKGKSKSVLGVTYTSAGTYYDTLATPTCDSVITINLFEKDYLRGTHYAEFCKGYDVTVNGKVYDTPGIYPDTITNSGTCDSIIEITVFEKDYLRGTHYAEFCKGYDISVYGKVYDTPGIYPDTIPNSGACDSIIEITVFEKDYLRGFETVLLCPGEDTLIRGKIYSAPGIHHDTLTTATCDSVIRLEIIAAPVPDVYLGADTSLCQGQSLVLQAASGYQNYYWNDDFTNSVSSTFTANAAGEYWVEVENIHGCSASDTMEIINVYPLPVVSVNADTTICFGDSLQLNASGGVSYSWTPGNSDLSSITVAPQSSAAYTVRAFNSNNCPSAPEVVTVFVNHTSQRPLFDSDNVTHCLAESPASIGVKWGETFYWPSTGDTTKSINVSQEGVYEVEVLDANGCSVKGEIFVEDKCETMVFVPEAFSPNYDGLHDKLEIFGKNFTNFEMRIFNRWGEIIFMTHDPEEMWDGMFRGKPMPVGSYPYVIQYTPLFVGSDSSEGAIKRLTGSVTLVR